MSLVIEKLMSLGSDQMVSQFHVLFPEGIPGNLTFNAIDAEKISLRIDQSFDIPSITMGEAELYFRGSKIVKPIRTEESDKHMTLQCRVDGKWKILDTIKLEKNDI